MGNKRAQPNINVITVLHGKPSARGDGVVTGGLEGRSKGGRGPSEDNGVVPFPKEHTSQCSYTRVKTNSKQASPMCRANMAPKLASLKYRANMATHRNAHKRTAMTSPNH